MARRWSSWEAKTKLSDFAVRLHALMEFARLDVPALALAAGLSRQGLYRLLSGERKPSWATVQALATALKVSTEKLRDL